MALQLDGPLRPTAGIHTNPPEGIAGDAQPALSPGGQETALVRDFTLSESDLHVLSTFETLRI